MNQLLGAIGGFISTEVNRSNDATAQMQALSSRLSTSGDAFPGSGHKPTDRKTWMAELGPERVRVHQVVWPGSHNAATNEIGSPLTRPFAQCQSLSVYDQLAIGCRLIDVRVQETRRVCHGPLVADYSVDVVLADVKRFLADTVSELVVLEVRTEFNHHDPPEFGAYLVGQLGEHLIRQDEAVFGKTIQELLPGRVICVWKPNGSPAPGPGEPLWSAHYLRDNWTSTVMPETKFNKNMECLAKQPDPVAGRRYLYRVENTLTAPSGIPMPVEPLTRRIHGFARLFIAEVFAKGHGNKLQVFSTDFIDDDFVDACYGVTRARVEGDA